jgi:heptosyltransferase-2
MKNIYIQTAFLGDLLLAIPSLKLIRQMTPRAHFTLVCRKGYGGLMEALGLCDRVIEVDKKTKKRLGVILKEDSFHTLFCPHQSFSSHQLVRSLRAEIKVGYYRPWNSLYFDQRVVRNLQWPEAIRQIQLVAAVHQSLQIKLEAFSQKPESFPPWAEMTLPHPPWTDLAVQKLLKEKTQWNQGAPYICIAPGSVWPTKRWPQNSYSIVSTELARRGFPVLILGAPDERDLCEQIQKEVPYSFSLAGRLSVLESMMVLSHAKGLICNDSGAMHMASLVACPTVSIFGPTVTELGYKPWSARAVVLEDSQLLCRPCGQHGGLKCPIGTHQCMENIIPQQVIQQAEKSFNLQ